MKPLQYILLSAMLVIVLAAPGFAAPAVYPVTGKWGQSTSSAKGAIDCSKLRVIGFNGDQRTDSGGGVPAYRIKSVSQQGPGNYRVVDQFTTGQINNGSASFTLQQIDADHIVMNMQPGGTLKLQRCK
ncbi:MAG: hypothetical protein WAM62_12530 [Pseudolabrys sp.]|jgi:hypothetical protein